MRHWGVTTPETPVIPDELIHDSGDEESAIYKNNWKYLQKFIYLSEVTLILTEVAWTCFE